MKRNEGMNAPSFFMAGVGAVLALVVAAGSGQQAFGQAALPSFGNISSVSAADTADTADAGDETNPKLASDAAGNLVVVAQTDERDADQAVGDPRTDLDIAVSFSSDGGASWSDPQALNSDAATDSGADMDPAIATDADGTWVTVWHAVGTGSATTTDIRWARSDDNGATWTDAAALTHAVANINPAASDATPQLATDGAGTWIIVWMSSRDIDGDLESKADPDDPDVLRVSTDGDIFFAISTDNAETFGPARALNTDNVDDNVPDASPGIAADGAGNWMAVWESGGQIVYTRSENDGTVWTSPLPVDGAVGTDPVFLNDGAREATGTTVWYCVWQADGISVSRYLESDNADEDEALLPDDESFDEWLAPISISGSGTDASIANDAAGRLIVSWQDGDIVVSLSVNVGREWTAPGAVDPDGDAAGTGPQAAPAGSDSWVILWSSAKDRDGSGTDADLVVAPFTFGVFQDCNGNGTDDAGDIAAGTSEDCNGNGIPDECNALEADNDGDGIIDACDDTPFGDDDGSGGDDGNGGDTGDDGGLNLPVSVPCGFGIILALPGILLGLTWMKMTGRRRRRRLG